MYRNKVQLLTQPQWAYYTPQLGTARSNNTKIITVMTCCKLNLHLAHFACAALVCYWLNYTLKYIGLILTTNIVFFVCYGMKPSVAKNRLGKLSRLALG